LESFLRIRRADGSVDSFSDVLAAADETGHALLLERETLNAACAQLHSWSNSLPGHTPMVTVNISRRQLFHPALIAHLMKALATSGADPSRLWFEVPESAFNEDPDAAVAVLQRLADWGVRVAVDDFGSCLAPLHHLLHLPIGMIKLASKLTAAALSPGRQLAVLEALLDLGNKLGVAIAAQGIQTPEQLAALSRMGCPLGQGPLFSSALDPDAALELARAGHWELAQRT
ncbi:MAG: EAL domain-containing protein, partial [Terracidiphilus sp.]